MKFIECLKNVKAGNSILYRKGQIFDIDNINHINYDNNVFNVNFENPEYFRKYNPQAFEIGTDVMILDTGNKRQKKCFGTITGYDKKQNLYFVYTPALDTLTVGHDNMSPVESYWFINTKGKFCHTYSGKCVARDKWCQKSGNKFESHEDAVKHMNDILKK